MFTDGDIETIVTAELDSLLWSSAEMVDDDGEYGEFWDAVYDADNATPTLRERMKNELQVLSLTDDTSLIAAVTRFRATHYGIWTWQASFGHETALTRNHHGVGFWDRGLGETGDVLTEWAHTLGELNPYVVDAETFSAE